MSTDEKQWVVHVKSAGKDFIRSELVLNKKATISSSFESNIVLRKLQDGNTKIQLSWVPKPPNHGEAAEAPHGVKREAEKPERIPYIQINSESDALQVDGAKYLKPYLIGNDITMVSLNELTIILSTQKAFDAYLNKTQAPEPDDQASSVDGEAVPAQVDEFVHEEEDTAVAETEMLAARKAVKAQRSKESKLQDIKKQIRSIIDKLPTPSPAMYAAGALSAVFMIGTFGYFGYSSYSQDQVRSKQHMLRMQTEAQQKTRRKKHRDIHNDFNAIMAYYPNLQLSLDYDVARETAVISGYSSDTNQTERFVRSLKDDLGINVEFKIRSVEALSQEINKTLSKTAMGEVSLVYPEKGKLSCITSAYDAGEYKTIEHNIGKIAKNTGYPEAIKCTKVLFSKGEISFVSNTEYPFVKLKNGSVFFKDSEISQGVFLVDIDDDKLTFSFQNTKFYLTLR